jgi:hypothetical protein
VVDGAAARVDRPAQTPASSRMPENRHVPVPRGGDGGNVAPLLTRRRHPTCGYTSPADSGAVATQLASWIRELSPSLLSMFVTWVVTVRSEMKSLAPIC